MNALHQQMLRDFRAELKPLLTRLAAETRRLVRGMAVWLVTGDRTARRRAARARRRLAMRTVADVSRALAAWAAIGVTLRDLGLHDRNPGLAALAEATLYARRHSDHDGRATPEAECVLWRAMYDFGL